MFPTSSTGLVNTYRIPFGSSIIITLSHPIQECTFWYIVRGVENMPVVLGDLVLPNSARLRLYKNEAKKLSPFEYYTLASVQNKSGALFLSTLKANSSDLTFLEACYRVQIDGGEPMLLSSGTEDFFLSAYYFNKGTFHTPNAGLTAMQSPGFITAYKFFEEDPVLFTKSLVLRSRCGEDAHHCLTNTTQRFSPGAAGSCTVTPAGRKICYPRRDEKNPANYTVTLAPTEVTTYTWIYEWDSHEAPTMYKIRDEV